MDKSDYLEHKLKPIIEGLIFEGLKKKPSNPVNSQNKKKVSLMIEYLQKLGGYTSSGLTQNEKSELESLRRDIKKYRDAKQDKKNKNSNSNKNEDHHDANNIESEDDPDDVMEEEILIQQENRKKTIIGPRSGVSAEVYNADTKKNFVFKEVEKSDEQIQRIKLKILQSFLFENLEGKDVDIVVKAMEEKIFL